MLRVMDVATGEDVDGPIDRARLLPRRLASRRRVVLLRTPPGPGLVPEGEEQYHRRVWLHRLGTSPDDDVLVFGDGQDTTNYYGVSVSWTAAGWSSAPPPAPSRATTCGSRTWATASSGRPELRVVQEGVDAQHIDPRRAGRPGVRLHRPGRTSRPDRGDEPRTRGPRRGPNWCPRTRRPCWRDSRSSTATSSPTRSCCAAGPVTRWGRSRRTTCSTGARSGSVPMPGLGTVAGLSERPEGGHEAWFGYTDHVDAVVGVPLRRDAPARRRCGRARPAPSTCRRSTRGRSSCSPRTARPCGWSCSRRSRTPTSHGRRSSTATAASACR